MRDAEELIACGKMLKARGLVSLGCNKGSLSVRIAPDRCLFAPSRVDYDELSPGDLNLVSIDGTPICCDRPLSMDTAFHLAVYRARPDLRALIHTHAKYQTALALVGCPIPIVQYGMKLQFGGSVDVADYYAPGDERILASVVRALGKKFAVLMKNHGGLAAGTTLAKARENILYLEELSAAYVHARQLGSVAEIG